MTDAENTTCEGIEQRMEELLTQIRDEERRQSLDLSGSSPIGEQMAQTRTLGDVLQQAAAREFQSHSHRIRSAELRAAAPSGQKETSGHLLI